MFLVRHGFCIAHCSVAWKCDTCDQVHRFRGIPMAIFRCRCCLCVQGVFEQAKDYLIEAGDCGGRFDLRNNIFREW
jgi:hypothetical protein